MRHNNQIISFIQKQETQKHLLLNLYRMAFCDGETDPEELDLLYKRATEFGISERELASFLMSPNDANLVPSTLEDQIFVLYHLTKMAYADGIIKDVEREFLYRIIVGYGFEEENAPAIVELLLEQVGKGVSYEELLRLIQGH